MQQRFVDQVAIVTGAAYGIGAAIAAALFEEGALVFAVDINPRPLDSSPRAHSNEDRYVPLAADVSNADDITSCMAQVKARSPRIDILVNNAGINMGKRLPELELADWNRVFDTNLRSVYLFCQAVWPVFQSRRAGSIVNIASVMGQVGGVGAPAYCSTKAGIIMLSRCLAKDGARDGIRVNSICPGYIDTPIMEQALQATPDPAKARRDIIDKMPLGRMGGPDEIAAGALFLASAAASYISGTELTIDGALTATQID